MAGRKKQQEIPELEQLKAELKRERYKKQYWQVLRSTAFSLVVVAAAAVLVVMLWMPVLRITGNSMTPTLHEGEYVVSLKGSDFETGDLLAFYVGNKVLIKRCIAGPGDWVDMDQDGNIYVNDELLYEPYVSEKSLGACDIALPYQVPEDRWFVVGDHRSTSVDSRNTAIGSIAEEQIVGKIAYRVWPLGMLGTLG